MNTAPTYNPDAARWALIAFALAIILRMWMGCAHEPTPAAPMQVQTDAEVYHV